jgi:hypothetical protein
VRVKQSIGRIIPVVDDVVAGFENAVRKQVVAYAPKILSTGLSSADFRGNDCVGGHSQIRREMPPSLVDEKDGVGSQ